MGAPTRPLAVGSIVTGKCTWFGGPNDHSTGPTGSSGIPISRGGMSFYNYGTEGHYWKMWMHDGRWMVLRQIDIGPAPWTGAPFDMAYVTVPLWGNGMSESTWPNPIMSGQYLGAYPGPYITAKLFRTGLVTTGPVVSGAGSAPSGPSSGTGAGSVGGRVGSVTIGPHPFGVTVPDSRTNPDYSAKVRETGRQHSLSGQHLLGHAAAIRGLYTHKRG